MKKNLSEVPFDELKGKNFEIIRVVELLCEVCGKPLDTKQKSVRETAILSEESFRNLLNRAAMHDRAEVDTETGRIYFYDHDFPGDVHAECIAKL